MWRDAKKTHFLVVSGGGRGRPWEREHHTWGRKMGNYPPKLSQAHTNFLIIETHVLFARVRV